MAKYITFFIFLFIGASVLSAFMEGGGGIVTVALAAPIDADDVSIQVASTSDFLSADYIVIGEEKILYTNTDATHFLNCTRGYDGTTAKAHTAGAMIYTADASAVNSALGFSIAATSDSMGIWAAVTIPFYFLTRTLPHIVMMNFSFLSGQLAIVGWFFFAAGAGLIITLAISLAGGRRV